MLVISVRDRGVGIDAEDLKNVFEPFNRSSNPAIRQMNSTGNGIGLSICK